MKSRDVIKYLQDEDPTGDADVVVGNCDIHLIERVPGYYNGPFQVLVRNPSIETYNIVGARITNKGDKVRIQTLTIKEAIFDNRDLPVVLDLNTNQEDEIHRNQVELWRDEVDRLRERIKSPQKF